MSQEPSRQTTSIIQAEMMQIHFPSGINQELVEVIQKLSELLKLPEFTSTFELQASHQEIMDVLKEKRLVIRFINSSVYNSRLALRPKDCYVDDEYGWFDGRVNRNCVNINYDFYGETNGNLPFLKVLALVTAIHGLQHFLRANLKKEKSQPISSVVPSPQEESGDSWEVKNLGGRVGMLSHRANKNEVFGLYLKSILNGEEIQSLLDTTWADYLLSGVSQGRNVFPLVPNEVIHPIPDTLFKDKLSHKCHEDFKSEVSLSDAFIKHIRPNDTWTKIGSDSFMA